MKFADDHFFEQFRPEHLDSFTGVIGNHPKLFIKLRLDLAPEISPANTHRLASAKKIAASAFRAPAAQVTAGRRQGFMRLSRNGFCG